MTLRPRLNERITKGSARAVFLVLLVLATGFSAVMASPQSMSSTKSIAVGEQGRNTRPDRLLVKFSSSKPSDIDDLWHRRGGREISKLVPKTSSADLDDWFLVEGKALDVPGLMSDLKSRPDVQALDLDYLGHEDVVPNDPMFSSQWNLQTDRLDAPDAWNTATSSSIIVAIVDSGVDFSHPDLKGNEWVNPHPTYGCDINGYNFAQNTCDITPDDPHGTRLAGIVGAVGNNGIGVTGTAWSVKIMGLKVIVAGVIDTNAAAAAITYAVDNGAKVVNTSWGIPYSQVLYDAFSYAHTKGVIMTTSAGNSGSDNDSVDHYPSNFDKTLDNVVALANTQEDDTLRSTSNYGAATVQMAAPGTNIWSTCPLVLCSSGYNTATGTSDSAPHFAGAAALIWAKYTSYSYKQVITQILDTGDQLSSLTGLVSCGCRLNLAKALGSLRSPDFSISGNPSSLQLQNGTSASSTITVSSIGDFAGSVSLAAISPVAGLSVRLNPSSVTITAGASSSSTLNIGSAASSPAGVYGINLTGTSGGLSHLTVITVKITSLPPPIFSLEDNPTSLTIQLGSSASSTITLTPANGFSDNVALTATLSSSGPTTSFNPPIVMGGSGTSILTISTPTNAATGSYLVTVTGSSPSVVQSATLTVTVAPPTALNNNPPILTVQGSPTTTVDTLLTLEVNASDPDPGETITLQASGLPPGATFDTIPGSDTGSFAWKPSLDQAGQYTVTFTAEDNGAPTMSSVDPVTLQVNGLSTSGPGLPVSRTGLWLIALGCLAFLVIALVPLNLRNRSRLMDARKRIELRFMRQ